MISVLNRESVKISGKTREKLQVIKSETGTNISTIIDKAVDMYIEHLTASVDGVIVTQQLVDKLKVIEDRR